MYARDAAGWLWRKGTSANLQRSPSNRGRTCFTAAWECRLFFVSKFLVEPALSLKGGGYLKLLSWKDFLLWVAEI